MSLLVLGTVALDTVKTPFGKRKALLGGSAAHFSMSARLFTKVELAAVVGEDFPRKHIAFLAGKGLDLTSLITAKGKTFHWEGEYRGDLNQAITLKTELGVLADFTPRLSVRQRGIKNVFLANVDPEIQERFLSLMRSPRLVGLDSMNYWIHTKRKALLRVLKKVDIFVANDQESRDLSGEVNLVKAAKCLRALGPRIVLIKKGEHGVMFFHDDFTVSLPGYPIDRVIDPTGAGDTFAGGFMGYLSRAKKISRTTVKQALAYGTAAASINVEGFGLGKTSRITLSSLRSRFADFRRIVVF